MVFGDHQVWSSSGVLLRVVTILGLVWMVVGLGLGYTRLVQRRAGHVQSSRFVEGALAVGLGTLAAASLVAFLPINVSNGYVHCGTALVTEFRHSCRSADFAWHRALLVVLALVSVVSLSGGVTTSLRAPGDDTSAP